MRRSDADGEYISRATWAHGARLARDDELSDSDGDEHDAERTQQPCRHPGIQAIGHLCSARVMQHPQGKPPRTGKKENARGHKENPDNRLHEHGASMGGISELPPKLTLSRAILASPDHSRDLIGSV